MITHFKENCVEINGMRILRKYEKMAKYILIDCGGFFTQNPSYEGEYFVFEGISFGSRKEYEAFEKKIQIHTNDFVEIRKDNKLNYIKNRIKSFFKRK